MLGTISTALSSLNAAKDIVKGLDAARIAASINEVKIELQSLILNAQQGLFDAQEAQTAAAERIRALEAEIVRLSDWSAERQRYELKKFHPGTLAYVLKPSMANGEPLHMLCKQCYDETKKSTLQATSQTELRRRVFRCGTCKANLIVGEILSDEDDKRLNG